MPPLFSTNSGTKDESASQAPSIPRQRTLDKFFSRTGSSIPPTSSTSVAQSKPRTSKAQPAPRSSFAVVLPSSPSKRTGTTPMRTVEDDADDLVISDLSPQFRRLAAQAKVGVSLAKPVLPRAVTDEPDEPEETEEPEVTSLGAATPPPQPRKRGRPKGFRPSLTGKKASQEAGEVGPRKLRPDRPKTGALYAGKRRGRPPKAASPKPRDIYKSLNPHFNTYICEWEGCRAELHNFETLQRHVSIVHTRTVAAGCRWAKCAQQRPPREFSTLADLKSHVEDLHMLPIAWQVGDGPQVSFKRYDPDDGTKLPDYLFDKAGNQVTPSIKDQKEEDLYTWRHNRRKLRDLLLLRDQNMPSEEEEDDAMEDVVEGV
ncbi:hypothetical protein BDP55DRAFT_628372 [Colletotrichum godetiae]|uniref:C2H2-type domain-containing protein n=1 Tax=Colletotrichum godetiae TaxID=1209918 RepID=A0AAJ0AT10_9PEZI|nr:uncharacterized protein BDP55DRAFT_628372 [Colletotrichum godetiae]KAK1689827.1 hypothetical protein BDP55DRAFT_628372 [Colletotrichum godetiae]